VCSEGEHPGWAVVTEHRVDACVVGAGLVGLAVGRALLAAHPGITVAVVDKEARVAGHQSSHNSGVVHSGLYYRPGSLKARLCVEGRDAVFRLGEEWGVPVRRSGKLVIATDPAEIPALDELERRGRANGLEGLRRVDLSGIRSIEPEATGIEALHVPEAGVADYPAFAERLAAELRDAGSEVVTGHRVTAIDAGGAGVVAIAGGERILARALVNCAGLHSDRVARLAGIEPSVRIVPFRGEYYRMDPDVAGMVRALVYPVPDPRFPFLGVHFTRRIDGTVEVGPNAVLAMGREQYRGERASWPDAWETLRSHGFRHLAMRHWRSGAGELVRSRSRRLYSRQARRLIPAVRAEHLLPGGSGVRAQALAPDGSLVDDFVIERAGSTVHVLNAPSPGATAALAIGRHVAVLAAPLLEG
jgi:L-2-hydroxyglutarate oxidase